MGVGDFIILGVIAVLFVLALRRTWKHKGGCGGCEGCEGCGRREGCGKK